MRVPPLRIVGIDVARGLAVLGMFVAHTLPRVNDDELIVDGRSSILFATLAGVSLGLLTGAAQPERSDRGVARRRIAMRAAVIFMLGVALSVLPSNIAVILDYYGVMFLLMLPVLYLPRPVLAALAPILAVAAPVAASAVNAVGPLDGWAGVAAEYLLVGSYPALVWMPFLIVGLLATRSGLTRPSTQRWMIGGGLAAMVLGYGGAAVSASVSAEAHSGSTAEIIGSGGFAIALIGCLLWLDRVRAARLVLTPVAAAGSMPLTIYTLQVLVLAGCAAFAGAAPWIPDYPGLPLMLGLIAVSLLFGVAWRWLFGAGPLERMLRLVAGFERSGASAARRRRSA